MTVNKELYENIKKIKKSSIWSYLNSGDLMAIQLPRFRDPIFVSLIEDEDLESAYISIYQNYADLSYLFEMYNQINNFSSDKEFPISCTTIYFEDREDIDKYSYNLIKESGVTFRGKKEWPEIILYHPDYEPSLLDPDENDWLEMVLEAFLETAEYFVTHGFPRHSDENEVAFPGREYYIDGTFDNKMFVIPDHVLNGISEQTYKVSPILVTQFEILRAKTLEQKPNVWELKTEQLPRITKDFEFERGFYPLGYAMVDGTLQEVIDIAVFKPDENELIQRAILRIILNYGYRPKYLYVESEYYSRVVAQMGEFFKALAIEISWVDNLPITTFIEQSLQVDSLFQFFYEEDL